MNSRKIKIAALFAAAAMLLSACGKEKSSGSGTPLPDNTGKETASYQQGANENANPVSDFEYTVDETANTVTITRYNGNAKEVVFPSEIDGKPVTALGWSVLHGNDDVISVVIPDSVTTLNNEVFQARKQLKHIKLSKNLTEIPREAFIRCEALESIEIPEGVTVIDYCAFLGCKSLKSVSMPDSVTECDRNAFSGCESLPEVEYRGTTYKNSDGGGAWDMYDLVMAIRVLNEDKE